MSLLTGKPMWMHWIFFVILSGLIFGVSYGLIFLLALRWWIAVLAILAVGMIWGTVFYKQATPDKPKVMEQE